MVDLGSNFNCKAIVLLLHHYCTRNIFIRKLLQPPHSYANRKQYYPINESYCRVYSTGDVDNLSRRIGSSTLMYEQLLVKEQQQRDAEECPSDSNETSTKELSEHIWPHILHCIVKSKAEQKNQMVYQVLNRFVTNTIGSSSHMAKRKITTETTTPTKHNRKLES
jgi:hypothetical protein